MEKANENHFFVKCLLGFVASILIFVGINFLIQRDTSGQNSASAQVQLVTGGTEDIGDFGEGLRPS